MPHFFYKEYDLVESLKINANPNNMPRNCIYCANSLYSSDNQFTAYGHDIWYELRFCGRCGWWDLVYRNDMESGPHDEESYYQSRLRSLTDDEKIDFASVQLTSELLRGTVNLYEIPPRRFEELIKSILSEYLDCRFEMTKTTRDGGKDLIGIDSDHGPFFVEVKRYKKQNKVGVGVVRDFIGAMFLEGVQTGFLVSSSGFTQDAKSAVQMLKSKSGWKLHLRDANDISAWLKFGFDRYFNRNELNNIIGGLVSPGPGVWDVVPESWVNK